ncbi:MAG: AMP-binding protein [Pseudomonadota bacterium]
MEIYWEPEAEMMPSGRLKMIQEERFLTVVEYAHEKTAFYKRKFEVAGIKPTDITSLEDLLKLPLTSYLEEFAITPIEAKLALDWESITEIMTTSGTVSGKTLPVAMTEKDVEQGFGLFARAARMAGLRPDDTIQLLLPWDAAVPLMKRLASRVLSGLAGRMILDQQIELARTVKSTVILGLPSYVLMFLDKAREMGINIRRDTSLRLAILVGEPLAAPVKNRIREETGIELYDIYGFAEVMGIGGECSQRDGLHLWADHYLLEVVDIETLAPLTTGKMGELVITTLTKEAMPLVRYRTGDVTMLLDHGTCQCERTHPKIAPVRGRVYHMVKVQGKIVFPSDIDDFVGRNHRLGREYQVIVDRPGELDMLRLRIEYRPGGSNLRAFREELEEAFENENSLRCEIELVPQGTLTKTQFKAQRIVRTY